MPQKRPHVQRPQPVQIICICPDICAFSVLHHRHLSDICAFCQKCQFEVKKGWQVLLLQSKAEDMHCKQADSAMKLWCFNETNNFISKQTYVVITCFCRNMGYVAFTRILSQIAFCHEYALFWFCFVQTFTQTLRILLRFFADICPKNWSLRPLTGPPPSQELNNRHCLTQQTSKMLLRQHAGSRTSSSSHQCCQCWW